MMVEGYTDEEFDFPMKVLPPESNLSVLAFQSANQVLFYILLREIFKEGTHDVVFLFLIWR